MKTFPKTLIFIFLALVSILNVLSLRIVDSLIKRGDIFYQQPHVYPNELRIGSIKRLKSKKNLKFIIHGFFGNRFGESIHLLGQAYLAQGYNNIFLADWGDAATLDYYTSRRAVGKVGKHFAQLIEKFIKKHDIPLSEIHIIGHSLGAHIAGNIGRYFEGSLGRITGLDPALPLFDPTSPDSIQSNAGIFVDIVHTDFPVYGDITPRGTVDFYPNYGHTPQAGCNDEAPLKALFLEFIASCSHSRAVTLYAESIGSPKSFPTVPCELRAITMQMSSLCLERLNEIGLTKYELIEAIKSENQDVVVYMGEAVSKKASGIYFLETYDAPPYGMGIRTRLPWW